MKKNDTNPSLLKQRLIALILAIGLLGLLTAYGINAFNQRRAAQEALKERGDQWALEWTNRWGLILDDLERTFLSVTPTQDPRNLDNEPSLVKLQHRNPAIEHLAWVPVVRDEERNNWQSAGWRFLDWNGSDWLNAPRRPAYAPMAWTRPAQPDLLGWDLRSSPSLVSILDTPNLTGIRVSTPQQWPNRVRASALANNHYIVLISPTLRYSQNPPSNVSTSGTVIGYWLAWVSAAQVWPEAISRAQAEGLTIQITDARDTENKVWSSNTEHQHTSSSHTRLELGIRIGDHTWQMHISPVEPVHSETLAQPLWLAGLLSLAGLMLWGLWQSQRWARLDAQALSERLETLQQTLVPSLEERLRNAQTQYEQLWTHTPVGLALVVEGVIQRATPQLLALLGIPEGTQFIGESPINWFTDEHVAEQFEHEAGLALSQGQSYTAQVPLRTADQREIWTRLSLHPFTHEEHTAPTILWSIEDCSWELELKRLHSYTQQLNTQLETQQTALNTQLIEANQSKKALLISLNEDLRQPLNTLLDETRLLLGQHTLDESAQSCVVLIQRAGKRLSRISHDLLDMAKSHSGGLVLDVSIFSVHDLLKKVQDAVQDTLEQAHAVLQYDAGEWEERFLRGDMGRLAQVIIQGTQYLLHTTHAKQLFLMLGIVQQERHYGQLSVRLEMTEAEASPVFKRYQQLTETDVPADGRAGLGWAVCRRLIEQMGGRLFLEKNRQGQAVAVCFTAWLAIEQMPDSIKSMVSSAAAPNIEPTAIPAAPLPTSVVTPTPSDEAHESVLPAAAPEPQQDHKPSPVDTAETPPQVHIAAPHRMSKGDPAQFMSKLDTKKFEARPLAKFNSRATPKAQVKTEPLPAVELPMPIIPPAPVLVETPPVADATPTASVVVNPPAIENEMPVSPVSKTTPTASSPVFVDILPKEANYERNDAGWDWTDSAWSGQDDDTAEHPNQFKGPAAVKQALMFFAGLLHERDIAAISLWETENENWKKWLAEAAEPLAIAMKTKDYTAALAALGTAPSLAFIRVDF